MDKVKIISQNDTKIRIIGDNILYNNGVINAYYIMPLTNYSITSYSGIDFAIGGLLNILTTLCSQRANTTLSMQRFSKVIRKDDVVNNLYETIQLYTEDFDIPYEFTKNLNDDVQDYCLLGIGISEKDINGVEDMSLGETAKQLLASVANSLLNSTGMLIDEEKILLAEKNIYSIVRSKFVRASKELVFYNLISNIYPSYEISYDKLSFINENSFTDILGSVTQTMEDHFGYFVMHNEGVDLFDLEPQDTYGCILNIAKFPLTADTTNFSMNYPGCQVNIKAVSKDQAKIQLKRIRAADRYEFEESIKAGAEEETLEDTMTNIDIATNALQELEEGTQMCEFTTQILVLGNSLEQLRQNLQYYISDMKDRDILPQNSLNHSLDFINGYVKLMHTKYNHFAPLLFPLSFQLNSGALVGDADGKYFVPSIGEDL